MNKNKEALIPMDHILESIEGIEFYIKKTDKDHFLHAELWDEDILVRDGILHRLAIVGEAIRRIPASVKKEHNAIPWQKIADLRNVVIHQYDDLDLELIWMITHQHLKQLKSDIKKIKKDLEKKIYTPSLK